ncbi:MAG: hypothetical protein ACYTBP_17540, partial [Planctomycetota bacterium]
GEFFPETDIDIDLVGKYLYVTKETELYQFYYKWILRVPKSESGENRKLYFTRYDDTSQRLRPVSSVTLTSGKLKNAQDVVVELTEDFRLDTVSYSEAPLKRFLGGLVSLDATAPKSGMQNLFSRGFVMARQHNINPSQASVLGLTGNSPYKKQKKKVYQQIPPERIDDLIREYRTAKDPIVQVDIQEQFAESDSSTSLILADSLIALLGRGQYTEASDYALLLTDSDFMSMFSANGRYRGRFNVSFYSRIIDVVQTGSTFERNTFIQFLEELRDPRIIPLLWDSFSSSENEELQRILLDILGSFATYHDNAIREEIWTRLETEAASDHPQKTTNYIQRTMMKFEGMN